VNYPANNLNTVLNQVSFCEPFNDFDDILSEWLEDDGLMNIVEDYENEFEEPPELPELRLRR